MSRLLALLRYAALPGFRSGNRRNQILAAIGYVLIAVALFGGYWYSAFLGIFAISVVFLATNAWGLRALVPGFRSPNKATATATWIGYAMAAFLVVGTLTATVDAAHLAASRAAQASRTTPVAAAPAVGPTRSQPSAIAVARITTPAVSVTALPTFSGPAVVVPTFAVAAAAPSACAGRDPHDHVYNSYRLVVLDPCKTATGTVTFTRREADGDWHIGLRLDPGQESLLDPKNVSDEQGDLIVEVICALPVTQADAISACAGYTNAIPTPAVGSHISVTGPYVLDADHGWNEIHPVWSISTTPEAAVATPASTSVTTVAPFATVTISPVPPPTVAPLQPTFVPAFTSAPTAAATATPAASNLCGASSNPWGYNFCAGSFISSPPSNFCSYFACIASFWNGIGYVMQCSDLMFSLSGGRRGSCSYHGGNYRPLYAP